uniref:Proteasome 26S subunit, ATPase 3 n=1 Tax=Amphiprion percula TaxID=161767 RepID=A0A3P8S907_AMPPE
MFRSVTVQTHRAKMASLSDKSVWDEVEDGIGEEVLKMSTEEIVQRTRLLDSEIKIMKSEVLRVTHELQAMKDKIKENTEKIKVNKTLPYLVSNVIELLDVDPNDQEEDGTYFLPVIGLVDAEKLKPGDLVGVNKDSYLILETLPTEYDSRVKAMEVDERPTEQYSDYRRAGTSMIPRSRGEAIPRRQTTRSWPLHRRLQRRPSAKLCAWRPV